MLLFSGVGIVWEVLTDQGLCFMSPVMRELLRLLQVKQAGKQTGSDPPVTSPSWTSPRGTGRYLSPSPIEKRRRLRHQGDCTSIPSFRPHQAYAAAYLDDIIIHSASWDVHLRQLRAVLVELRKAGLTANPAKCRRGLEVTTYLGYQVRRGKVRLQECKVAAIRDWPRPMSKKQAKSFLGLVGYYQRFIPGFATLASPLND